jgi:hypothetical protein
MKMLDLADVDKLDNFLPLIPGLSVLAMGGGAVSRRILKTRGLADVDRLDNFFSLFPD